MSEKTEQPTDKKKQDSRKKGQVAQSQDIPKLIIVAVLIEVVFSQVDSSMSKMQQLIGTAVSSINQPFHYAVESVIQLCALLAIPLITTALVVACALRLASTWLQFGFIFSGESLKPTLNKISPLSQLKNIFSGKKLFELFNSIIKIILLSCVFYNIFPEILPTLIKLPYTDLVTAWHAIITIFLRIERDCVMLLVAVSLLDFGMQKYFHLKSLKMSKDDIKQEYKNSEGDPHMKGHRKALARELADSPASGGQPQVKEESLDDSDVLLVNPTHYAVALYYNAETTPLPKIMHKGTDQSALDLIEQAKRKNIPVIKSVWLTRTIHKEDIGEYIPRTTLRYVAKIYQILNELDPEETHSEIIEAPMYDI